MGTPNDNPILDSRMYEVEYLDGSTEVMAANTIAENIMSQVDDNGNRQLLMDEIIDHRCDESALIKDDIHGLSPSQPQAQFPKVPKTTKGWQLCVQWRDGSYPIQVSEYALQAKIDTKPAFAW